MGVRHENTWNLPSPGALSGEEAVVFPIRHHSPACAWHLKRLIHEIKPAAIIVEGPPSFTALIPLMLDERTRTPFAIYTCCEDPSAPVGNSRKPLQTPSRRAAYYPFCDYSPELVAVREGAALGIRTRFGDLEFSNRIHAEPPDAREQPERLTRADSLMDERRIGRSRFLQALAEKMGCRDPNDLWDRLFEARFLKVPSATFVGEVAAYCGLARAETPTDELVADGTTAREAAMAQAVREEIERARSGGGEGGPVLMALGGFHARAVAELVSQTTAAGEMGAASRQRSHVRSGRSRRALRTAEPFPPAEPAPAYLIRYGFEPLDALNGYAAGMPSPFYYDLLWRAAQQDEPRPHSRAAARALVEIGRKTRAHPGSALALSPADEIAALEHAEYLARFRGNEGPTREDVLDAARACMVKGAMDVEGAFVITVVRAVLCGSAIGTVPPEAGAPPIVEDFRARARELRLHVSDSRPRSLALDIYRKAAHRRTSRFLYCLDCLGAPYAQKKAGPDFVQETGLDRLIEHWETRWTPQVESALIDAAAHGATVEEAAANLWLKRLDEMAREGRSRSAVPVTRFLVAGCRMGLHAAAGGLPDRLAAAVAEDPGLPSLAEAANLLSLLWRSREPLEAWRLPWIPGLIQAAYGRACFLARQLANSPADQTEDYLSAILTLQWLANETQSDPLDASLLLEALAESLAAPGCPPLLRGAAAGALRRGGRLTDEATTAWIIGGLEAASSDTAMRVAFLRGLLTTAREMAWRHPPLIGSLDALMRRWSDEEFFRALPDLRLAFADLTPRETDQVAALVARERGGEALGKLDHARLDEAEMLRNLEITRRVNEALRRDRLGK